MNHSHALTVAVNNVSALGLTLFLAVCTVSWYDVIRLTFSFLHSSTCISISPADDEAAAAMSALAFQEKKEKKGNMQS